MKKILTLLLCFNHFNTYAQPGTWEDIKKFIASDRGHFDEFGNSVHVSGNRAIVGANFEDHNAAGVDSLYRAGAAYVFERNAQDSWREVQKLVASDRDVLDEFGISVSISGDYAIVGAYGQSYDVNGGNWIQSAGSAYIFERASNGTWNQVQKITASDRGLVDNFGRAVTISGDYAMVGAHNNDFDSSGGNRQNNAGAAYVFKRANNGTWSQVQKIVASDRTSGDNFGWSLSLSNDQAIIGAYRDADDTNGANTLIDAGSAYIFKLDGGGTWHEIEKLVASDRDTRDFFGFSVSISGDHAIVGAYNEAHDASGGDSLYRAGSAYVFEQDTGGIWHEVQKIVASDRGKEDLFGISVSISGNYAVVGAPYDSEDATGSNPVSTAGSAFVFQRDSSGIWNRKQKLVASVRELGGRFGEAVAVSDIELFAGCPGVDYDTAGANKLTNAGAFYHFQFNCDNQVDVTISQTNDTLKSVQTPATYQWLDCNAGNTGIPGATGKNYVVTKNGNYAVEINVNGCIDTSSCVEVMLIGTQQNKLDENIVLAPNPTTKFTTLDLGSFGNANIVIKDLTGKIIIERFNTSGKKVIINASTFKKGIYLVTLQSEEQQKVLKLIKE